jgi:hypothetical protein
MPDSAAVGKALTTPRAQLVTITPGPTPKDVPTVDKHPCRVKATQEEIQWHVSTGAAFQVIFVGPSGSPFQRDTFDNVNFASGLPIVPPGKKHYKYVVSVAGGTGLDPDVIVDP